MGTIIAWLAYGVGAGFFAAASLLLAYGFFQMIPGAFGSSLRRFLFNACHPWLKVAERMFPVQVAGWNGTPFLAAAVLFVLCRFAVPWLVLWGYAWKG